METGILFREDLKEYDFGQGHPFRGDRYVNFYNFLRKTLKEGKDYSLLKAEPASDKDLQKICHQNYIEFTRGYYESANLGIPYPGRFGDFHSMDNLPTGHPGKIEEAARLVVGQGKLAVQLIMNNTFKKAISIGGGMHHAKPNRGEGFCLYNDVAFCALYAIEEYKLDRVVILDTDAHAGNGTMEYFYEDKRVLFIDLHQDPLGLYPGTGFVEQIGSKEGKGFTVNVPLPVHAGDEAYRFVFDKVVEPLIREFKPQLLIRNGGSDPHFADGLTSLGLTMQGFRMIGEKVRKISEVCDGKLIDLIASGYNPEVLPYAWLSLITGAMNLSYEPVEEYPLPSAILTDTAFRDTKLVVREVKNNLEAYWKCLAELDLEG